MAGPTGKTRLRNRRNTRLLIGLFSVVSLIIFFSALGSDRFMSGSKTAAEDSASPVLSVLTMPIRGFENAVESLRNRSRAHSENQRLKQELAQLRDVEARANAMAIKLSRFEKILNVDPTSGIPEKKIAARAVSEKNGPFVHSVLINAGQDKGVKAGHAVMTVDGFLGHVIRSGRRSSRVLHAEDLNSRIAVMSQRSQARAIMTGRNSPFPVLSFIAQDADWRDGDQVVTSGDGGVLPAGLPIGDVKIDRSGEAYVELFVNRNNVDWVWVYLFEPIKVPVDEPDAAQISTTEQATEGEEG